MVNCSNTLCNLYDDEENNNCIIYSEVECCDDSPEYHKEGEKGIEKTRNING